MALSTASTRSRIESTRGSLGRATRTAKNHPDDPAAKAALETARQTHAHALITAFVTKVTAAAPLLTDAQCEDIAAILRGAGDTGND